MKRIPLEAIALVLLVGLLVLVGMRFYERVPARRVAVATLFGEVQTEPY